MEISLVLFLCYPGLYGKIKSNPITLSSLIPKGSGNKNTFRSLALKLKIVIFVITFNICFLTQLLWLATQSSPISVIFRHFPLLQPQPLQDYWINVLQESKGQLFDVYWRRHSWSLGNTFFQATSVALAFSHILNDCLRLSYPHWCNLPEKLSLHV